MNWFRGVGVNMPACHAGDRGFDSRRNRHSFSINTFLNIGAVAQLVEQRIEAPCVGSSTLSHAIYGGIAKWLNATDCKSVP